jgi:hypothetical protein
MIKPLKVAAVFAVICYFYSPVLAAKPANFCSPIEILQQKIKHPTEAMTNTQVSAILNNMRQKKNDAEKVTALKEGVKDKGITVEQLITLLNQFLTDDSKLDCAVYAFPYTTNYKSFLKIMDLFSQEGYKWKLEDYYDKNKK